VDIAALRSRLQNLLRGHLGVIRNEQELLEGLQKTDELLAQLGDHRGCFVKHRLYNDLLTARIALVSALQRKQSIGCHYREDSQTEDIPYRIIVEHQDGSMILSKESV